MSCAHPFYVYDDKKNLLGQSACGRCINCLVDWSMRYIDECREELMNSNYIASYVTVTYDRYHCPYVFDWQGNLRTTIKRSDYQKFLKRLRDYISRKVPDSVACQHNFRYCVSAEYGESNYELPRCHFHFIFFGLDYRFCEKFFHECWKAGEVDVKPVQPGAFRYVVEYMHKQVKSFDNPRNLYESKNRARPFFHHSKSFGSTLYKRFYEDAKENNWTYPIGKGKRRPFPSYIRRKYGLISAGESIQTKRDRFFNDKPRTLFSLKAYNKHLHSIAQIRENNLSNMLRSRGVPVNDDMRWKEPNYSYLKFFGDSISETPREFVSALQSYEAMSKSLYGHNSKWSFKGFEKYFPSYHSESEIIKDVNKYGDLVPF